MKLSVIYAQAAQDPHHLRPRKIGAAETAVATADSAVATAETAVAAAESAIATAVLAALFSAAYGDINTEGGVDRVGADVHVFQSSVVVMKRAPQCSPPKSRRWPRLRSCCATTMHTKAAWTTYTYFPGKKKYKHRFLQKLSS